MRGHWLAVASVGLGAFIAITPAAEASGTQVTSVAASLSVTTAGQSSNYTISFKATSGLIAGSGTVTLSTGGESGTTFPATASKYSVTDSTRLTTAAAPAVTVANGGAVATLTVPKAVMAGDSVKVVVTGVVNPPLASAAQTVIVATSSDTVNALSPTFAITASASGSGTAAIAPTTQPASSPTTLTETYTAAAGGLSGGSLTITVPTGWTAPNTTSGSAGYVTSTAGSVSTSGQVITVSGLTMPSGGTFGVTYGAGGGSNAAVTSSTAGTASFVTMEKSTTTGTLTKLTTSPSVNLTLAADGSGTATASPSSTTVGIPLTVAIKYVAAAGGMSGGTVTVTIPTGWTAPTTTAGKAGYTTASTGTVSISGQKVTVSSVTLTSGSTLTITYGATGGAAAAVPPASPATSTFAITQRSKSTGTLTAIASSPVVNVTAVPDGAGTMTVAPGSVLRGSPTSLTFTYTAGSLGLSGGALSLGIPSAWTAPSVMAGTAGFTTASSGTVSVSGQTVTVNGLTLAAGATLTVTYGSGGGVNQGISATTVGFATFATSERSRSTGTMAPLASSPSVAVVASPDGSGTASISPSTAVDARPQGFTLTYTAAAGGLVNGAITVTTPSGWTPPSTTAETAGYTQASSGSVTVSGSTITVSGLTLSAGDSVTIGYGTGDAADAAVGPVPSSGLTFAVAEKSTETGQITSISSSPNVAAILTPVNSSLPMVTGFTGIGTTLTGTSGTWYNSPTSYAYVWQRCDASGGSCSPIPSATASTYLVQAADSGHTILVVVTATNGQGTGIAASTPSNVIGAPGTCPTSGATDVWTGGSGSTSWSDAGNWSSNAVPTSSDFVCLPSDTTGSGPIALPSSLNVKRLLSFKQLTISSGLTTVNGADLETNATWQGGTISGRCRDRVRPGCHTWRPRRGAGGTSPLAAKLALNAA